MVILVDQNQIHKTCPAGTQTRHHRFLLQLEGETLSSLLKVCGFKSLLEFGAAIQGNYLVFRQRVGDDFRTIEPHQKGDEKRWAYSRTF